MHAFAGVRVGHGGFDAQFVGAGGEAGEGEPVVVECGGVQGVSVEGDGSQGGGPDLDEGVSGRAGGETDDGGGVEGVGSAGEIEVDRVPLDVDELSSGLRFVARQYGHGDMLPHASGGGQVARGVLRQDLARRRRHRLGALPRAPLLNRRRGLSWRRSARGGGSLR